MILCPACDTPLTKPECSCGFLYRPPQLELAVHQTQRKPDDLPEGLIDYANV